MRELCLALGGLVLVLSLDGCTGSLGVSQEVDFSAMAAIPSGSFAMGHAPATPGPYGAEWKENELPQREVTLSAFRIDKTEVTVAAWAEFVGYPQHAEAHFHPLQPLAQTELGLESSAGWAQRPVHQVSWFDAVAYCGWLGKRLPTEAEWERAARGPDDDRRYPWGAEGANCSRAVYTTGSTACSSVPQPVGSTSPAGDSPEGLSEMAGNVAEWVSDRYGRYGDEDEVDPRGPENGRSRVVRGGSFRERGASIRTLARWGVTPGQRSDAVGFRCAVSEEDVP
jgi:formylglycine-generating enzyme required for sulfatase activity